MGSVWIKNKKIVDGTSNGCGVQVIQSMKPPIDLLWERRGRGKQTGESAQKDFCPQWGGNFLGK